MLWTTLFSLTNGIAGMAWLLLLIAPRRPTTHSLILYAGVGLLCLIYMVLLTLVIAGAVEPNNNGAMPFDYSNYSIEGIRSLFLSDAGVVIGWTHYLAFDLFVGLWVARDADNKGFSRVAQAPFLLLIFLAGPLGLFLWLAIRERRARAAARS